MICHALLVLALNSYHESRGEPFHGQVAVAQVVLRRANYDQRKVCRVVYAYRQFSWTAGKPPVGDRKAWAEAVRAAKVAMLWAHGAGRDYSAGADHYHTIEVCPRWSRGMTRVAVIGAHEFYRGKTNTGATVRGPGGAHDHRFRGITVLVDERRLRARLQ